jgi:hypothetical protein
MHPRQRVTIASLCLMLAISIGCGRVDPSANKHDEKVLNLYIFGPGGERQDFPPRVAAMMKFWSINAALSTCSSPTAPSLNSTAKPLCNVH